MTRLKSFLKHLTVIAIAMAVLMSGIIFPDQAQALNGPGNKAANFLGYAYVDSNHVKVFIDKGNAYLKPGQVKIFKGNGVNGEQVTIETIIPDGSINFNELTATQQITATSTLIRTLESFQPGEVYTVLVSSTVAGNNKLTIGNFYFNQDSKFSFEVPDAEGKYYSPVTIMTRPENNATRVPWEGNLGFTVNQAVYNYEEVQAGIALKKNGEVLTPGTETYLPVVNYAHNSFYLPMTGSGTAATSYNLDPNSDYTLIIPPIKDSANTVLLPEQTIAFHTTTVDLPKASINPIRLAVSDDSLSFEWDPLSEATGYNLYVSQDPYWNFVKINADPIDGASHATTFAEAGLNPFQSYYFRYTGVNAGGETGFSPEVAYVTTDTIVPNWEDQSTVTVSDIEKNSLSLNWTAATDNSGVVDKYRIYCDDNLIATVEGNSCTYQAIGLNKNTQYIFKIEAGDAAGNWTTNGPEVSALTTLPLVWDAATDNVTVTKYKLLQDNQLLTELDGNTTSYSVCDLSPGTQYTFRVEAGDAAGNWSSGGPSLAVTAGISAGLTEIISDTTTVASDGSNKNLAITANSPGDVSVTVPQGVDGASINVSSLLSNDGSGVSTSALPALNIVTSTNLHSSPVDIRIPAGTTVSAPASWDGTINVPAIRPNNSVAVTPDAGKTATVQATIEVGYGDVPLTFSRAVKIVIPGQAGKYAGYSRGGVFTSIPTVLTAKTQPEVDAELLTKGVQEGKQDEGTDLVIWTKHFTPFVTYTQTIINNGGGGGPSGDNQAPTWPSGSTVTGTKDAQEVNLSWTAANDNVGVVGYKIRMDGSEIASVNGSTTTYRATNISGQHTFKIEAGDAAGNWSTNGPSVYVSGTGNNPLNYISSNLTSINGTVSTAGNMVDGSNTVPVKPIIRIVFDRNVTNDIIWTANQQCFTMQDSGGSNIPITVSKISNTDNFAERQHVFITPVSNLTAGKTYKIIIGPSLKANNGNTLGNNATISFTVTGANAVPPTTNGPSFTTGDATVDPAIGAMISQGDHAKVIIPANAFKESSPVVVKIQKVESPPAAPGDAKAASDVYEFTVGNNVSYLFAKDVSITMSFNLSAIGTECIPALFYYDEAKKDWVQLEGTVTGNTITVNLNHFTKFAVFAVKKPLVQPEAVVPVVAKPVATLKDTKGHWAEAKINKLLALGAIRGYLDGSFRPDANITRAEFVTVLVKAFKLETKSGKVFDDTKNNWAKEYIATATAYGITSGYNDQIFGADDFITREQMVLMVVKAAKLAPVTSEIRFADQSSISAWARDSMATAIKNGIIKGFFDNTVRPKNIASRAEAITIIANALK